MHLRERTLCFCTTSPWSVQRTRAASTGRPSWCQEKGGACSAPGAQMRFTPAAASAAAASRRRSGGAARAAPCRCARNGASRVGSRSSADRGCRGTTQPPAAGSGVVSGSSSTVQRRPGSPQTRAFGAKAVSRRELPAPPPADHAGQQPPRNRHLLLRAAPGGRQSGQPPTSPSCRCFPAKRGVTWGRLRAAAHPARPELVQHRGIFSSSASSARASPRSEPTRNARLAHWAKRQVARRQRGRLVQPALAASGQVCTASSTSTVGDRQRCQLTACACRRSSIT